MVDAIKIIQDYAQEEGFDYYIDPEKGEYIEVHHFKGGARAHADGRVESALNFKLKAVMEKKIAEARAYEAQFGQPEEDPGTEFYLQIKAGLRELSDDQLARLIDHIRREQMDREGEHSADLIGGAR